MISRSISLSAGSFMMMMLQQLVLKSSHLWLYVFFLSNIFGYISKKDVVNRIYERVIHEAKRWPALVVPKELRGMPQDVWHMFSKWFPPVLILAAIFWATSGNNFLENNHFWHVAGHYFHAVSQLHHADTQWSAGGEWLRQWACAFWGLASLAAASPLTVCLYTGKQLYVRFCLTLHVCKYARWGH